MPRPGADGGTPALSSAPAPRGVPGFAPEIEARPVEPRTASAPPAREGTPAPSQRIWFVPAQVVLPGGATAPVFPVRTVNGELKVPEQGRWVGWWDGGAQAGDPFGSVVLAGHVDTRTEGIGYFARLLRITPGELVVLHGSGHTATYRVSSVVSVPKDALATHSGAFDQEVDHRLVLITCTGAYDAARGGYEENLIVTATPTGPAR
ncbi:class F sortase [Kribbella swartbergensis]